MAELVQQTTHLEGKCTAMYTSDPLWVQHGLCRTSFWIILVNTGIPEIGASSAHRFLSTVNELQIMFRNVSNDCIIVLLFRVFSLFLRVQYTGASNCKSTRSHSKTSISTYTFAGTICTATLVICICINRGALGGRPIAPAVAQIVSRSV
jgi:hypothetical protein